MAILFHVLAIIVASLFLVKGAQLFTDSVGQIAHRFGVSSYTISFFLVAVGTSLPETVVAITSGINKDPILSFGVALGSNVALLTIVAGLAIILARGIRTRTIIASRDIYFTLGAALMPVVLVADQILSRLDGGILLASYLVYATAVIKKAGRIERLLDRHDKINLPKQVLIFSSSLAILLTSSQVIVQEATSLSSQLGIEIGFIGLTITALGTSLPEIAFVVAAVKRAEFDGVLGDIVGSVVANSTLVLGIAAIIYPINLTSSKIGVPTLFFVVLSMLVFLRLAKTGNKLSPVEGILLVLLYIAFIMTESVVQLG